MSFTNRDIIDLHKSIGLHETSKHVFDSPAGLSSSLVSIKTKIFKLKTKHAQLVTNSSRPIGRAKLAAFLEEEFRLPVPKGTNDINNDKQRF